LIKLLLRIRLAAFYLVGIGVIGFVGNLVVCIGFMRNQKVS
jgi:hypothetical protein